MVKIFFYLFLFYGTIISSDDFNVTTEVIVKDDLLTTKIKSFLGEDNFNQNKDFINLIFDPRSNFYINDRVDSLRVIKTLKENGLLKLFFEKPHKFTLNFKTNSSPVFFVKVVGDTLRNIGYFRYVTTASTLNISEFIWSINIRSEYATDPLILQKELQKSGCEIVDVSRDNPDEWTYNIDTTNAYLNVKTLDVKDKIKLRGSLYSHWLNVSKIKTLHIKSSLRNRWYPYISYYDASLHLLKITKKNKVFRNITLELPKNTKYIKISDSYTLKNVKDSLTIIAKGER